MLKNEFGKHVTRDDLNNVVRKAGAESDNVGVQVEMLKQHGFLTTVVQNEIAGVACGLFSGRGDAEDLQRVPGSSSAGCDLQDDRQPSPSFHHPWCGLHGPGRTLRSVHRHRRNRGYDRLHAGGLQGAKCRSSFPNQGEWGIAMPRMLTNVSICRLSST